MADKPIGQLPAAPSNLQLYSGAELLVLEQDGTAKKLSMRILENWLLSFAAGHGGIRTISKTGTSGLVDTYTITFADQSTATFTVTNGNGITGVTQYWAVSSSNTTVPSSWSTTRQTMTPTNKYLWSYMTFARDSGSFSTTKSVVGVYGDTGQAWYVWIRYAGRRPTSDADIGTEPDNWMGVYSGTQSTAPTSYTAYQWFEIKGETGNTGATGASIASVTRTGGTGDPGSTDTYTITLDTGTVAGTFTVYNGLNGTGAVATVNGVQPDQSGNVALTAANINTSGGQTVQATLTDLSENKQTKIAANGILKGNGSGVVSAVSTIPVASGGTGATTAAAARANLGALSSADGAVTRAKLAQDALISPFKFFTGNSYTIAADDIGVTIMNSFVSGDRAEKTVNLTYEVSHAFPMGAILIVARPESNPVKISFGEKIQVGIPGNDDWIASPTVSISNRFSTVALMLKSSGAKDYWILTGEAEVVT